MRVSASALLLLLAVTGCEAYVATTDQSLLDQVTACPVIAADTIASPRGHLLPLRGPPRLRLTTCSATASSTPNASQHSPWMSPAGLLARHHLVCLQTTATSIDAAPPATTSATATTRTRLLHRRLPTCLVKLVRSLTTVDGTDWLSTTPSASDRRRACLLSR
jgi:hypothetical protein